MKKGIHPEYKPSTIVCSCGNEIETRSTEEEIHVEICSVCHPFYTGRQKLVDTAGRVERFQRKYGDTSLSGQEVEEEADQEEGAEESASGTPSGAADSEEAAAGAGTEQPRKIPADSPEEKSAEATPQGASGEEGGPETEGEA